MAKDGVRLGVVSAWVSLALMLSVQAGMAIWWAGVQNTRVSGIELGVAEMRRSSPDTLKQMMAADRQIAVLESRLDEVLRRLDEIGATLDRIGQGR
ncbi:MAG: hypothetical protein ACXIUV_01580 [Alkalilacustris sp.]